MEQLNCYVMDPNTFSAFQLAFAYEELKQLAGAIDLYLEVADSSTDPNLVYESLIRAGICYQTQGHRNSTAIDLFLNAIAYNPKNREGYFLLSRLYEHQKNWHESYVFASIGLQANALGCLKPIQGFNSYAIKFQKAVAAWWVGKTEESRELMYEVYNNSPELKGIAFTNLRNIGYPRILWQYKASDYTNLINPFPGSESIKQNYAQSGQDMFVLAMLDGKKGGRYLEIGSADPIIFNNTYLLEKDFEWSGTSIDISYPEVAKFNTKRKNPAICADALIYDYNYLKHTEIDYLQVDCEPAPISLAILQKVMDTGIRPKVITFEHDRYLYGPGIAEQSRTLLKSLGYTIMAKDVCFDKAGSYYEDWWVKDPPQGYTSAIGILGINYFLKNSS